MARAAFARRHDPDRSEAYAEIARAARAEGRTVGLNSAKPCFAIALDATGSMSDLIDNARRSIGKILNGIYAEAKTQVKIKMYVYRDYDVPRGLYESSDLTGNSQALSRWLTSVRAYGGGSNARGGYRGRSRSDLCGERGERCIACRRRAVQLT